MSLAINLAEAGRVPDFLLRAAIRMRLRALLRREVLPSAQARQEVLRAFIAEMQKAPVAPAPLESNRQHYEVPSEFFQTMLGPRLKYSACLWSKDELDKRPTPDQAENELALLSRAEEETLALTARRAGLADGMRVLDLGCGWGSFSLWAAENYPNAHIWAVSNSKDQGEFIRARAEQGGFNNLQTITADMNHFHPPEDAGPFDRVVSVEMFEHMRNWPELLRRIAGWLGENGKFFMHIFSHRQAAYPFRQGDGEWMSRYFFTGGIMPADSLLLHLQQDLVLEDHWRISGLHYTRTIYSWLSLLDAHRDSAAKVLAEVSAQESPTVLFNRWRIFLLACAESFAFEKGNQWLVSHYRMAKRRQA